MKREYEHSKRTLWTIVLIIFLVMIIGSAFNIQGQTRAEVLKELVRQEVKHPEIVMAQCRLETGNLTSHIYIQNNNLFGMKRCSVHPIYKKRETTSLGTKNNHAYYSNWKQSIADYKLWQDRFYKGAGDYYKFLEAIGYAASPTYIKKLKEFNITKNQ